MSLPTLPRCLHHNSCKSPFNSRVCVCTVVVVQIKYDQNGDLVLGMERDYLGGIKRLVRVVDGETQALDDPEELRGIEVIEEVSGRAAGAARRSTRRCTCTRAPAMHARVHAAAPMCLQAHVCARPLARACTVLACMHAGGLGGACAAPPPPVPCLVCVCVCLRAAGRV